jgi:GT2 family glycosyltransferase
MSGAKNLPRVYVLAPVHNRRAITEHFIRCLMAQTYSNWHLVLIDDGSTDGTKDMARALISSLTVLVGTGNWWWGGSLQQGFKWLKRNGVAADDVVLIVNDDTEFGPDFIAAAVEALPLNGMLLAQLYGIRSRAFEEVGARWDWESFGCVGVNEISQVNCFATRGLFLRFADMLKTGGFRPWLMPHYYSDYEYTLRARRRGLTFATSENVRLYYDDSTTGIRKVGEINSVAEGLRTLLSLRTIDNPIYRTSFILLCCPSRYWARHLKNIWRDFFRVVLNPVRKRVKSMLANHQL